MEALTLPIHNISGKETESVKLDHAVFDGEVNADAVHQAVLAYQACQRKGLASTKTMGEVSGGGRKPWKQKGTGRARVGSIRSPLWRHGGVVFGPHPRDFSYTLPAKIKRLALRSALNAKINENNFIVLEEFKLEKPKTREALKLIAGLNPKQELKKLLKKNQHMLLLLNKIKSPERQALRNISFLNIGEAKNTHAYEILKAQKIIVTKDALSELTKRLK